MIHIVKHGRLKVSYSTAPAKRVVGNAVRFLPHYWQQDYHSCGFVAALTVAKHLNPDVSPVDVLRLVRPTINGGVDRHALIRALHGLGIQVDYRRDLNVRLLRRMVEREIPVIVSVWPEDWYSDHWTVVQGFGKHRIHLVNHYSMTVAEFRAEWSDFDMRGQGWSGEGLVCR